MNARPPSLAPTHAPTHPPLCKKIIYEEILVFSGFLEGFNEWIGGNIFLGHNSSSMWKVA
jgi:hypothetical protein